MNTTAKAAQKLRGIMLEQCLHAGLGFRLTVNDAGSDSPVFNIQMDYGHPDDEITESHGIRLLMDKETAAMARKFDLDYTEEPAAGFSLSKPGGRQRRCRHTPVLAGQRQRGRIPDTAAIGP